MKEFPKNFYGAGQPPLINTKMHIWKMEKVSLMSI